MSFNSLILLFFTLGALQGVLLALLLRQKYRSEAGSYLSAISALFGVLLLFYVAFWARAGTPVYLWWVQYVTFLIGPLFYGLAREMPFRQLFSRPAIFHLLPFALAAIVLYLPLPAWVLFVAQPVHLLVYSRAVFEATRTKKPLIRRWVLLPLAGYTLLFVLYSVMVAARTLTLEFDYLISFGSCIFIFGLLVRSYLQPQFIHQLKHSEELSSFVTDTILSQVTSYMEEKKPYLNGEYRLSDLSRALQVKPYQLSEVINTRYEGFAQLLTEYRIREAIALLNTTDKKIIDIAFMSGFNNKVSFYKSFRKTTGKTPVEWRSGHQKTVNISVD